MRDSAPESARPGRASRNPTDLVHYFPVTHLAYWEFLFRPDTAGAFDLRDEALRNATRYTA